MSSISPCITHAVSARKTITPQSQAIASAGWLGGRPPGPRTPRRRRPGRQAGVRARSIAGENGADGSPENAVDEPMDLQRFLAARARRAALLDGVEEVGEEIA